jgi:hypothetical protein
MPQTKTIRLSSEKPLKEADAPKSVSTASTTGPNEDAIHTLLVQHIGGEI